MLQFNVICSSRTGERSAGGWSSRNRANMHVHDGYDYGQSPYSTKILDFRGFDSNRI